jgi:hypothetical protein
MPIPSRFSHAFKVACLGGMLLAPPVPGHAEPWNTPYDKFFEAENAEVTIRTEADGTEVRRVMTPGNVEVRQYRKDGNVRTVVMDDSGYGAVLCVWDLYVSFKFALEACYPTEHSVAIRRLGMAIDRISAFIVENSLEPTPIDKIEAAIEKRRLKYESLREAAGRSTSLCKSSNEHDEKFFRHFVDDIEGPSEEEFTKKIESFLSVPRLPAMNPCL